MNLTSPQPVSHSHICNAKFAGDLNRCQALGFVSASPPLFGQRDPRLKAMGYAGQRIGLVIAHQCGDAGPGSGVLCNIDFGTFWWCPLKRS